MQKAITLWTEYVRIIEGELILEEGALIPIPHNAKKSLRVREVTWLFSRYSRHSWLTHSTLGPNCYFISFKYGCCTY